MSDLPPPAYSTLPMPNPQQPHESHPYASPTMPQPSDSDQSLNTSQNSLNSYQESAVFAELPAPPPLQPNAYGFFGPYLRYVAVDYSSKMWYGSALIVSSDLQAPTMTVINSANHQETWSFTAVTLEVVMDNSFYRYDMRLPMSEDQAGVPRRYEYFFKDARQLSYSFFVASVHDKSWRWSYNSCNGWSSNVPLQKRMEMGNLEPLWRDLLAKHAQKPILVVAGGGDQVYADPVWKLPCLIEWLKIRGRQSRLQAPWTNVMEFETTKFYFELYLRHFGQAIISDALASIPTINAIDDHDLWDGLGSYPDWLEQCPVFQNLRRVASKFYLLFQQQTNEVHAAREHYIGVDNPVKSYSFIRLLGPETAVVSIDTRSERTQLQVCSPMSWNKLIQACYGLPPTIRHLVIITGVPIVYPRMEFADKAFETFGKVKRSSEKAVTAVTSGIASAIGGLGAFARKAGVKVDENFGEKIHKSLDDFQHSLKQSLGKNGAMKSVVNIFGLPELADDLNDHWTHQSHFNERSYLISLFQQYSATRRVRVTFVGGDVHCCGVGRLFNASSPNSLDHFLMYQIVSSAIGNIPPPPTVISNVNNSAKVMDAGPVNTKEEMIDLFNVDVDDKPLKKTKLLGRRNYCIIEPLPQADLVFTLNVENVQYSLPTKAYSVAVPPL